MYNCFDISKQILDFAKQENITISPMKLLKLVYITHGYHLGFKKGPLINNTIQAWRHGPVIPDLYKAIKKFGNLAVDPDYIDILQTKELLKEDKHFVQLVWNAYKNLNGLQLSTLTHQDGTPWDIVYKQDGYNNEITDEIIENYYTRMIHDRTAERAKS